MYRAVRRTAGGEMLSCVFPTALPFLADADFFFQTAFSFCVLSHFNCCLMILRVCLIAMYLFHAGVAWYMCEQNCDASRHIIFLVKMFFKMTYNISYPQSCDAH